MTTQGLGELPSPTHPAVIVMILVVSLTVILTAVLIFICKIKSGNNLEVESNRSLQRSCQEGDFQSLGGSSHSSESHNSIELAELQSLCGSIDSYYDDIITFMNNRTEENLENCDNVQRRGHENSSAFLGD